MLPVFVARLYQFDRSFAFIPTVLHQNSLKRERMHWEPPCHSWRTISVSCLYSVSSTSGVSRWASLFCNSGIVNFQYASASVHVLASRLWRTSIASVGLPYMRSQVMFTADVTAWWSLMADQIPTFRSAWLSLLSLMRNISGLLVPLLLVLVDSTGTVIFQLCLIGHLSSAMPLLFVNLSHFSCRALRLPISTAFPPLTRTSSRRKSSIYGALLLAETYATMNVVSRIASEIYWYFLDDSASIWCI